MASKLIEKLIEASNKNYSVIFGPVVFTDGLTVRVRNKNWISQYQFRSTDEANEENIILAIEKCIDDIETKKLALTYIKMKGLIK